MFDILSIFNLLIVYYVLAKPPDFSKYIDLASLPKHELRAGGGRIVFVGDIHGMDKKLLKKLNYDANHDMLIHTGDIILKGPQSRKVIQELMQINALGVRGNQDQKVVEWRGWIEWVLSQEGGKPWLKKMEKRVEALKKPTKEDYKQFKKAASAKGWSIPDGWKFGDQIYQLARLFGSRVLIDCLLTYHQDISNPKSTNIYSACR
ncbi:Metallophos domain-containing protein [Rhizoctonia solani AG-1 IA]|uniref:Metallophos domain-containing protein n=1 Tax=Thanatephorus cucumeris (strain AG1-IA) TaxID=983506 RepID=L8WDC9_THACA|nr:Metallophos domain-containing protein [Rhizoctonia solani AG-1 IA]